MTTNTGPGAGSAPEWTVRGIDRTEHPEVVRVVGEALLSSEDPAAGLEERRARWDVLGYDRFRVAVEGDRIVGATNHFPFEMALPGGPRAVAGVTGVGVWPTRRRRGVLSALMRRQLADIHASGGRYAALWASEGAIYDRFGYGAASMEMSATVRLPHTALRADAPRDPALEVELHQPGEVLAEMARVHREVAAVQVGQFQRDDLWWSRIIRDVPEERAGRSPLKAAVVRGPDGPLGYALYRTRADWEWGVGGPHGEVFVKELTATAPAARTALYEHVLSRDLTTATHLKDVAVDDPLWSLVVDRQRIAASVHTALWVRLVDVPGALSERSYAAPVEAVVEVSDRYAPWNAGRWRIGADRGGARVESTQDAPDVSLDVSHLGAAYLGQHTLSSRVAAGVVTEHTPEAAERLDAALNVPRAPLCGIVF
ncbi:GNAT family N-acetyltransferase [Nocardiopsis sp. CT-R113]|uniref:GNAT family N-acetyltransferase n=1 Tax=Nocardiopsis codii TaxID=3065942 RepID=A0ABU7KE79_9ACTN|nr:GNAT family N-acetyltransferase [Nocardiopsis sp. CT-R113]MEE2040536.1 GNAT family N-acetyltransferase [Nocardiopsis sp. CT-R113]